MLHDPDRQMMEKAYARWAPIYDTLCGPIFVNGRQAAARAARDVGGRFLKLGLVPASHSTTTTPRPKSPVSTSLNR